MKHIQISDMTLCREGTAFRFKEKIEIARQLERLGTDVIELPEIQNDRTDMLLIRTVSSFVKGSILSVSGGRSTESVKNAAAALSGAAHPRIRIELPTSPVGMEYTCHRKPQKMLELAAELIRAARESVSEVEFAAEDATRSEPEFLAQMIRTAVEAGATSVTLCDSAAEQLPDDFAAFVGGIASSVSIPVQVACNNRHGMAAASAVLAVRAGASGVKVAVGGNTVPTESFAELIQTCGNSYGLSTGIRYTELHRIARQINWILDQVKNEKSIATPAAGESEAISLDEHDDRDTVIAAVAKLGYDLGDEDRERVYEEFLRVAAKKRVAAKELDAIVASVALQVPATYRLVSYVINNGNLMPASAQLTLEKEGKPLSGICMGDGPIDAAFRAVEGIIGHHYELDDFQIQSVTEGKEAMGSALVKLRSEGKLYSGNGISTDVIGASIRAYINAVNKIVYEEASV